MRKALGMVVLAVLGTAGLGVDGDRSNVTSQPKELAAGAVTPALADDTTSTKAGPLLSQ